MSEKSQKFTLEKIDLCYWGIATGKAGSSSGIPHRHDFFQAQFTISGNACLTADFGNFSIAPGDLLFIAPGVKHQLNYPEPYRSYTFKFYSPSRLRDPVTLIRKDTFTDGVIEACGAIMTSTFPLKFFDLEGGSVILPQDNYQLTMEYYLTGILASLNTTIRHGGISARIWHALENDNRNLFSVANAAAACGYSRNHFCTLVKEQTGMSAKSFLNRIKVENARRYLHYSRKSLSEIAELLGFSSQFHFSDFFKRETGVPPSQYRKVCAKEHLRDSDLQYEEH